MIQINKKLVFIYFDEEGKMQKYSDKGWNGGAFDMENNGQYFYKD